MKFNIYDIVSFLVPGFIAYLALLYYFDLEYNIIEVVPSTALAYGLGFFINTVGSWVQEILFITWGGRPSQNLLQGKGIWKIQLYDYEKIRNLLMLDSSNDSPSNKELFSIANRTVSDSSTKVNDMNSSYIFSRNFFICSVFISFVLILKQGVSVTTILIAIVLVGFSWYRAKQRSYYHTREILNSYLNKKGNPTKQ